MIFVLLPAYNEAANIRSLLQNLSNETAKWLSRKNSSGNPNPVHTVLINDGSSDATAAEALAFSELLPLTLLNHETNRGLAAALYTGISFVLAHGRDEDYLVTLDSDGTHHPRYIFHLVEKLDLGFDIVVASRYTEGGKEFGVSKWRKFLSHGARWCYYWFFPRWPLHDFSCGFRGMRVSVLKKTHTQWQNRLFELPGFTCTGELMLKLLAHTTPERVTEIPFELHYEQKGGKSKMPAFRTIFGTLQLIFRAKKWLKS